MERLLQKFENLKIEMEEIVSATNNFDELNSIGGGGFGSVYKGEVSHAQGRSIVAIKRLDRRHGQGEAEFLKEITTLSNYRHENLISLLGFCYQEDEMILVYQLASRGSLDQYLNSPDLTWSKRIKICLDAAKGLSHLHDPRGTHQRLIHCDVKSGNILLDEHWNARVADFGFSTMGPANELHSTVITLAAGTLGYIDPLYRLTNTLTKESDVYSFGVVLFEVLFGRLCFSVDRNGGLQQILVPKWKEYYEEKKLNDIIFQAQTIQPLEQSALEIFSNIAYQCLMESREDRPNMEKVVTKLKSALKDQDFLESLELPENLEFKDAWNKQRPFYKKIFQSAKPPQNCRSEVQLMMHLLSNGILLNEANTWFSLNKKGEHSEMISIAECMDSDPGLNNRFSRRYKSRFPKGWHLLEKGIYDARLKAQFLSPGVTYVVNLVFQFESTKLVRKCECMLLKYRLQGETEFSVSQFAHEREDGWWMCELYHFTCHQRFVDLQVMNFNLETSIEADGFEFRPIEKMDDRQPISDSDADADLDLDSDADSDAYADVDEYMKMTENSVQWTTKEEAYSIMSKGFFINDYYTKRGIWFSLDENGKKCLMLSPRVCASWSSKYMLPMSESRFGEACDCTDINFYFKYKVQPELLSPRTRYAVYLVYKLSEDESGCEVLMQMSEGVYIYLLRPPLVPVIKPTADQNTHSPHSKLTKMCHPQHRNDGWMEVQLLKFRSTRATKVIGRSRILFNGNELLSKIQWVYIEGIEIRPI